MICTFNYENSLFKDTDVMQTGTTPATTAELLHRDNELKDLEYYYSKITKGKTADNVLMYGETGTGKTAMIKAYTRELKTAAELNGIKVNIYYINCNSASSEIEVYKHLLTHYKITHGTIKQKVSNSADSYFTFFVECLNKVDEISIIILDEIDKLKKGNTLYNLSRIKEAGFTERNVCIAGISNDPDFERNMEPREESSFRPRRIVVPPYTEKQLYDILLSKAEKALYPNTWTPNIIEMCATKAADKGDARTAIDLLNLAVIHAEKNNKHCIDEYDVLVAEHELNNGIIDQIINQMSFQKKLMLMSCFKAIDASQKKNKTTTTEAYEYYKRMCAACVTDAYSTRSFLAYLKNFDMDSLINITKKSEGRAKGIHYVITSNHDIEKTIEIIASTLHD